MISSQLFGCHRYPRGTQQWEREESNLQVFFTRLVYSQLASPSCRTPLKQSRTDLSLLVGQSPKARKPGNLFGSPGFLVDPPGGGVYSGKPGGPWLSRHRAAGLMMEGWVPCLRSYPDANEYTAATTLSRRQLVVFLCVKAIMVVVPLMQDAARKVKRAFLSK